MYTFRRRRSLPGARISHSWIKPAQQGGLMRSTRHAPAHLKRRSLQSRLLLIASTAALVTGVGLLGSIGLFYYRTDQGGHALLHRARAEIAHANTETISGKQTVCQNPGPPASGAAGIIEASSIGLTAPVVQGTGDSQLAVAVGHDPYSVWPGQAGTAVLSAHDVSWFSGIDRLPTGATVDYVTPCWTYRFSVARHVVVPSGSPVYQSTVPSLVMVTCYPLDALWITSKRYVVYATFTGTSPSVSTNMAGLPPPGAGSLATALPASIVSEVESKVTTTAPLGTLTVTGSPSPGWLQSTESLNAANSLLELYFGTWQILTNGDRAGWSQVAPAAGITAFDALRDSRVVGTIEPVTPALVAEGDSVTSGTVSATVRIGGGMDPGVYRIVMTAVPVGGRLVVSSWSVVRV